MKVVNALSFTSAGNLSTMHSIIKGTIPTELENITKHKLATGIHWTNVRSKSSVSRYRYVDMADSPMVHPANEIISSAFRPSDSTNDVELKCPITCTAPNVIVEMCGSMWVPDSWNITTLYIINVNQPQYWFRNVRIIATIMPLKIFGCPEKPNIFFEWVVQGDLAKMANAIEVFLRNFLKVIDSVDFGCWFVMVSSRSYSRVTASYSSIVVPVYPL